MSKKEKLAKIHKTASDECLENDALLECLISNAGGCPARCGTMLNMIKEKNKKTFYKIEKSREILKITN